MERREHDRLVGCDATDVVHDALHERAVDRRWIMHDPRQRVLEHALHTGQRTRRRRARSARQHAHVGNVGDRAYCRTHEDHVAQRIGADREN